MFDFKNGVLTIDTSLSVADSQAISAFADTVRKGEIERIIKLLESRKCPCYCEIHMVLDPAIEAIKGEK